MTVFNSSFLITKAIKMKLWLQIVWNQDSIVIPYVHWNKTQVQIEHTCTQATAPVPFSVQQLFESRIWLQKNTVNSATFLNRHKNAASIAWIIRTSSDDVV